MEGVIDQAFRLLRAVRKAKELPKENQSEKELLAQLDDVQLRLKSAQCRFDNALDEELVDAAVYELDALESRYAYLLRRAKQLGVIRPV